MNGETGRGREERERQTDRDRESQAGSMPSTDPNTELDPTTLGS